MIHEVVVVNSKSFRERENSGEKRKKKEKEKKKKNYNAPAFHAPGLWPNRDDRDS